MKSYTYVKQQNQRRPSWMCGGRAKVITAAVTGEHQLGISDGGEDMVMCAFKAAVCPFQSVSF